MTIELLDNQLTYIWFPLHILFHVFTAKKPRNYFDARDPSWHRFKTCLKVPKYTLLLFGGFLIGCSGYLLYLVAFNEDPINIKQLSVAASLHGFLLGTILMVEEYKVRRDRLSAQLSGLM